MKDVIHSIVDKPAFAGAALAGSQDARSAILNHRFGKNDPMKNVEKYAKEQAENGKKADKLMVPSWQGWYASWLKAEHDLFCSSKSDCLRSDLECCR